MEGEILFCRVGGIFLGWVWGGDQVGKTFKLKIYFDIEYPVSAKTGNVQGVSKKRIFGKPCPDKFVNPSILVHERACSMSVFVFKTPFFNI